MNRHYWSTVTEVRLFWDLDNVGLEDVRNHGVEVVSALNEFLDERIENPGGGFRAFLFLIFTPTTGKMINFDSHSSASWFLNPHQEQLSHPDVGRGSRGALCGEPDRGQLV